MFSKKFYITLFLSLLLLPSIYSLDVTPAQFKELTEILQSYDTLTNQLSMTLNQQKQTLQTLANQSKVQLMIIQQLDKSQRALQQSIGDLKDSYKQYRQTQRIKDYIMYGSIGGLIIVSIVLFLK